MRVRPWSGMRWRSYDQLAARWHERPIPFDFPLADGGTARRAFTLSDLEAVAAGQVYTEGDRMLLERALAGAARGDLVPLARLLYPNLGLDPQTGQVIPDPSYSDAIYYTVECQDYAYYAGEPGHRADQYLRAGDAVEASIPRLASIFYGDLPCAFWPGSATDPSRPAPLRAEGVPTLVLGATADPATPYGNGVAVFSRLADGYLVTQQDGPHMIFGRGNACPDDLVTAFLVNGRRPDERRTICPGQIADDYVPIAPADVSGFATAQDALSLGRDRDQLPARVLLLGRGGTVGRRLRRGGALGLTAAGATYSFAFDHCAFSSGFAMTGRGSYDADRDRFELHVRVGEPAQCDLDYVRSGARTRVAGSCDGLPVSSEMGQAAQTQPRGEQERSRPGGGDRAGGP